MCNYMIIGQTTVYWLYASVLPATPMRECVCVCVYYKLVFRNTSMLHLHISKGFYLNLHEFLIKVVLRFQTDKIST